MIHRLKKVPTIRLALKKFSDHKQRITQIVSAHGVLYTLDLLFDHLMYPAALLLWGTLAGGVVMTLASCLVCFLLVVRYEQSKTDWLGVDVLEVVKNHGGKWVDRLYSYQGDRWWSWILWLIVKVCAFIPASIFRLILWLLRKNDVFAFFALSIYEDPFRTTVFLKHGRFDGLSRRDWFVFCASVIFSNIYWIFRWSIVIEIFKMVF